EGGRNAGEQRVDARLCVDRGAVLLVQNVVRLFAVWQGPHDANSGYARYDRRPVDVARIRNGRFHGHLFPSPRPRCLRAQRHLTSTWPKLNSACQTYNLLVMTSKLPRTSCFQKETGLIWARRDTASHGL